MADSTKIEWTDATFNPWIGCTKVSPACDHCYAAASTPARTEGIEWGAGKPRRRTSAANWKLPLRWNAKPFYACESCGWRGEYGEDSTRLRVCLECAGKLVPARRRVFCASLADVFDNEVPAQWRADLFALIRATPNLDWLLLTKRVGNVDRMIADAVGALPRDARSGTEQHNHTPMAEWPWPNVWLGATICNQAEADRDVPKLLRVPAAVRFLSIEPMLGPINFRWQPYAHQARGESYREYLEREGVVNHLESLRKIDWVIAGGESGPHARPSHPDWFRSLRDQCAAADVPFLFKQWGEWALSSEPTPTFNRSTRDFETVPAGRGMLKVGKKAAGRLLDGVLHDGFPEVRHGE